MRSHFRIFTAHDEGIIINALYAGNREQGVVEKWHEIAQHACFPLVLPAKIS